MLIIEILIAIIALIFFFIGVVWILGKYGDYKSIKTAEQYCKENGLEVKEIKAFPNHYGLYFKKDGKSYYANYDFVFKKGIVWKRGSPLEKIEIKTIKLNTKKNSS